MLIDNIVAIYRYPNGYLSSTPLIHSSAVSMTDNVDVRVMRRVSTTAAKAQLTAPTTPTDGTLAYVTKTTASVPFEIIRAQTSDSKVITIPRLDYYGVPSIDNQRNLKNIAASAAASIGRKIDEIFFYGLWGNNFVVTDGSRSGSQLSGTSDGCLSYDLTTSVVSPDATKISALVAEVQRYLDVNMTAGGDVIDGIGFVWVVPKILFSYIKSYYYSRRVMQVGTENKILTSPLAYVDLDGLLCIGVDPELLYLAESGGVKPTGFHNTFLYKRDALHFMWKNLSSAALTLPYQSGKTYQDAISEATKLQVGQNKELASRVLALERLFTDGFGETSIFRGNTFDTTLEEDPRTLDSDLVFKMRASAGCVRITPSKIARLRIADANYPTTLAAPAQMMYESERNK
jgi:hypothetical protein